MCLAAAVASIPAVASAAIRSWDDFGHDQSWADGANWSNAIPGQGDQAIITSSGKFVYSPNYDYAASPVLLFRVAVDYLGGAAGNIDTLTLTNDITLSSVQELIGQQGGGSLFQSAGLNNITDGFSSSALLELGQTVTGQGIYTLTGGELDLSSATTGAEFIGLVGTGTFIQSGGVHTIKPGSTTRGLSIGADAGAVGIYFLSGGALNVENGASPAVEFVADQGTGEFDQSGGFHLIDTGYLSVGNSFNSTGNYNLSGTGILDAIAANPSSVAEYIAFHGNGTFTQSGGSNFVNGALDIAGQMDGVGRYNLRGGTLSTGAGSSELVGDAGFGWIDQTGGLNLVNSGNLILGNAFDATGLYTLTAGFLTISSGSEYVGNGGQGLFIQSGGKNQVTGSLYVGGSTDYNPSYTLSGDGSLSVSSAEYVGYTNQGLFNQTGGNNQVAGGLYVGYSNQGIFNQSGGNNLLAGGLYVGYHGNSTGTYALSAGGSLAASSTEYVGYSGTGNFNQTGGTNTVSGIGNSLYIAYNAGSTGTYSLSSTGSLSVASIEFIANGGVGNFNQSGGSNFAGQISIALGTGAVGTYTLSGGTLTAGQELLAAGIVGLGTASFVQTGGTNTASGITIANIPGSVAAYTLSGGTLKLLAPGIVNNGGTLTIQNTGRLDLTTTRLAINYVPGHDPIATIVSYLTSGYNGGAWTGTAGIVSTIAAQGTPGQAQSIGYADGNTDFGTAAAPNQILVKYTLAGDANLDGLVNFNDLVAVVQNFNKTGTDWAHGSFQYSASTNFKDLVAVVQNFNKTLTPAGSSGDQLGGLTSMLDETQSIQSTDVQLPEPSHSALLLTSAAVFLSSRRRRHKAKTA